MWASDGQRLFIDDIKVRKQRRFRFGLDGVLYLLTNDEPTGVLMQSDFKGAVNKGPRNPYGPKFWTFSSGADNSDQPYGLGLGHQLYWPVFFKRNDIKFWLIFLEKFGGPTAAAHLPKAMMDDEQMKQKVLAALRAIQTDSAVTFPEGAEIQLIEAARGGTADYSTLHERMNEAISKVILSQTMTTDNGSSLSQAKVHMGVRDEVIKGDADLVCGSFNRTVVHQWTARNFASAIPPRVFRKTEDDEDLSVVAERDTKIYALGYEPTEQYIREIYGDGWVKRDMSQQNTASGAPGAQLPADFAEAAGRLLDQRIRNRQDQASFVEASRAFAQKYEEVLGARVDQLVTLAEEAADIETFRRELDMLIAEQPKPETVDALKRGGFVARLMGAMRGQR